MRQLTLFLIFTPFLLFSQADGKRKNDTVQINGKKVFVGFKYKVGEKYPVINATTVNGEVLNSRKLKDSLLVLNCWFSQCKPCMYEIPGLNKLKKKYQRNRVVFWAVGSDDQMTIKRIMKEQEFTFRQIHCPLETLFQFYQPAGFPSTFVIKNGIIIYETSGGLPNTRGAEEIFEKLDSVLKMELQN